MRVEKAVKQEHDGEGRLKKLGRHMEEGVLDHGCQQSDKNSKRHSPRRRIVQWTIITSACMSSPATRQLGANVWHILIEGWVLQASHTQAYSLTVDTIRCNSRTKSLGWFWDRQLMAADKNRQIEFDAKLQLATNYNFDAKTRRLMVRLCVSRSTCIYALA